VIRPQRVEDTDAVFALTVTTFDALSVAEGHDPEPAPDPAEVRPRYANLVRSDPGGCWVAEEDGRLVGCSMAIMREGIWGLSLLIVHPERQSEGLGRELLDRAHAYGDGARARIILSSTDSRALRAYARLGLAPRPCLRATGAARAEVPDGVREGSAADFPLLDSISRHVRGAAHQPDLHTYLEMDATILIAHERAYAVLAHGQLRLLAGIDEAAAQDALRAALARSDGEAGIDWLSERQAWAIPVCLDAGLRLQTGTGAVWTSGDVGPFTPYLPSGAFL
jgi:GNAT superfamily N-acetyltransferase